MSSPTTTIEECQIIEPEGNLSDHRAITLKHPCIPKTGPRQADSVQASWKQVKLSSSSPEFQEVYCKRLEGSLVELLARPDPKSSQVLNELLNSLASIMESGAAECADTLAAKQKAATNKSWSKNISWWSSTLESLHKSLDLWRLIYAQNDFANDRVKRILGAAKKKFRRACRWAKKLDETKNSIQAQLPPKNQTVRFLEKHQETQKGQRRD